MKKELKLDTGGLDEILTKLSLFMSFSTTEKPTTFKDALAVAGVMRASLAVGEP